MEKVRNRDIIGESGGANGADPVAFSYFQNFYIRIANVQIF